MLMLEDTIKRKSIIIRGIKPEKTVFKAVNNIFKNKLKIRKRIEIESTKKIQESSDQMTVIAELKSEQMVYEVLRHTKNLNGSSIVIEQNLNCERLQTKKVMLQLKKEILAFNKSKRILVRNDRIRVDDKWMFYNKEKVLICNNENGEKILTEIYGDAASQIDIVYDSLLNKIISKN